MERIFHTILQGGTHMNNFGSTPPQRSYSARGRNEVSALVKAQNCRKVLVHFGGGSAKKAACSTGSTPRWTRPASPTFRSAALCRTRGSPSSQRGTELCRREASISSRRRRRQRHRFLEAIGYGVANDFDVWDLFDRKTRRQPACPSAACSPSRRPAAR